MEFSISFNYTIGRVLFGLCALWTGYNMLVQGAEFYSPFLHAWRRMLLPDSKNKISDTMTWEKLNGYTTEAFGALMMVGALLILLNKRVMGAWLVILTLLFMVATQDNPFIREFIKPKPKHAKIRLNDLFRHVSLIGACLYMIAVPPYEKNEDVHHEEQEAKKKN